MDTEPEELQFMGFFGIYKESYKITFSYRKIFSQITLALILPLSFIFLAQIQLSEFLFSEILHNEHQLDHSRTGSPTYNRIRSSITSEWLTFLLFKVIYLIFLLIFSLLSTSAVVYTIACIYTSKLESNITFTKIMTVVPKVWKRLMVTFLWSFAILFVYNAIAFVVFVLFVVLVQQEVIFLVCFIIFLICYLIGFIFISVVWQLASVVSVLEDVYGIKAMVKSKNLIKGKMWIASVIFLKLQISFVSIQMMFRELVVVVVQNDSYGRSSSRTIGSRVGFGMLCFVLLSVLILFGLVIQTVIYFVCKSYHHENIDKSCLADHLEAVSLGEYVPLKSKDVQLESF